MKVLAQTAAALIAFAPAAFATNGVLPPSDAYEIRIQVPTAGLSNLTSAQVRALSAVLHNGEGFDTSYQFRSILLRSGPEC